MYRFNLFQFIQFEKRDQIVFVIRKVPFPLIRTFRSLRYAYANNLIKPSIIIIGEAKRIHLACQSLMDVFGFI